MFRLAKLIALLALLVGYGMIVQKYQYGYDKNKVERLILEQWVHQDEKAHARILLAYKRECTGKYLKKKQRGKVNYTKYDCADEYASPRLSYVLKRAADVLEYDRFGMYKQFLQDAKDKIEEDSM